MMTSSLVIVLYLKLLAPEGRQRFGRTECSQHSAKHLMRKQLRKKKKDETQFSFLFFAFLSSTSSTSSSSSSYQHLRSRCQARKSKNPSRPSCSDSSNPIHRESSQPPFLLLSLPLFSSYIDSDFVIDVCGIAAILFGHGGVSERKLHRQNRISLNGKRSKRHRSCNP